MEPIRSFLSVVVPVYNEAPRIPHLAARLSQALPWDWELILVDDGSRDASFQTMRTLVDNYKALDAEFLRKIQAIRLDKNYGQQNATLAGLRFTSSTFICTMDADLQHLPESIPSLVAACTPEVDLVYGIPQSPVQSPLRRIGSRIRDGVFRFLLGVPRGLKLTSFRVMRRELLINLTLSESSFVYVSAELLRQRPRVAWVKVPMSTSQNRPGSYHFASLVKLLLNIIIHYGKLPITQSFCRKGIPYRIAEVYPCV